MTLLYETMQVLEASRNKAETYRVYVEHLFRCSDNADAPYIFKRRQGGKNYVSNNLSDIANAEWENWCFEFKSWRAEAVWIEDEAEKATLQLFLKYSLKLEPNGVSPKEKLEVVQKVLIKKRSKRQKIFCNSDFPRKR